MSVTFSVHGAPSEKVAVECSCVWDNAARPDCVFCHGTGTAEEDRPTGEPDLNMANGNAAAILALLGFTGEAVWGGSIKPEQVPTYRQKILVLRNSQSRRTPAHRETEVSGGIGTNQARCYSMGIDDDYVLEKLDRLDRLLAEARSLNLPLVWG